jgi:predicted AlkP superfamily pyrophosphatase or phosphodiesterase
MRACHLSRLKICLLLVALALATIGGAAQDSRAPILVLISFDGWRWDYITRAKAPNLQQLASNGVHAEGLIPVFPSKTFPNHYTIVTGLYPERHGIISNVMVDPDFPQRFTMAAPTARDARWWGGEPLWVTAIGQNQRSAAMFWPGSEAPIAGIRPTYWRPFDDGLPNAERVKQVLDWLALPADQQPSFVTLYFSEVDEAGHEHGPDSRQVLEAAARLDQALGQLLSGIASLNLTDRTNLVVVSDHGMSQLSNKRIIFLDDYIDLSRVDLIEWTPNLGLRPLAGSVDEIYRALKDKHPALAIYKREEIPEHLHYRNNNRIPPIVGLADEGWTITSHARHLAMSIAGRSEGGAHGYDPRYKSMHGLFVVAGPRIRQKMVVPAFENVHIYNLLCEALGLSPAKNDGDPAVVRSFLRN